MTEPTSCALLLGHKLNLITWLESKLGDVNFFRAIEKPIFTTECTLKMTLCEYEAI